MCCFAFGISAEVDSAPSNEVLELAQWQPELLRPRITHSEEHHQRHIVETQKLGGEGHQERKDLSGSLSENTVSGRFDSSQLFRVKGICSQTFLDERKRCLGFLSDVHR